MSVLARWCLTIAALGVVLMVTNVNGQGQQEPRTALDDINDKAAAARGGDPKAVRALVDEIFNRTVFANAPESIRDRITRAELEFRHGGHLPVSEQAVVDQTNAMAAEMGAPPHAKTNGPQLHLFRSFLRGKVHHFVDPTDSAREMSPAETAFVVLNLAAQKLSNDDYRVSPDEWVKTVQERQKTERAKLHDAKPRPSPPPKLVLLSHKKKEVTELYWLLDTDLRSETSEVTQGIHMFFDRIGIAR